MDPVRQNPIWLTCKPLQRMCNNATHYYNKEQFINVPSNSRPHHLLEVATEDEGWCSFTSCTPSRSRARTRGNAHLITKLLSSFSSATSIHLHSIVSASRRISAQSSLAASRCWQQLQPQVGLVIWHRRVCKPELCGLRQQTRHASWRRYSVARNLCGNDSNQSIINKTINQSTNQAVDQSIKQSINQSVDQPINQSVNQSINQ